MSGRVVHFEIPFDDGDRARAFYRDIFGWQLMEMPDMSYTLVTTGPTGPTGDEGSTEPGCINGMLRREGPKEGPVVVGDMGWAAYFKDVEGNSMGLWQTA